MKDGLYRIKTWKDMPDCGWSMMMDKYLPPNRVIEIKNNRCETGLLYDEDMIECCEGDYPCLRISRFGAVALFNRRGECIIINERMKSDTQWNPVFRLLSHEDYEKYKHHLKKENLKEC